MKYIKATEVLPADLVEELRKYAEGCILYVSNKPGPRRGWGEATDTKTLLSCRNTRIRSERQSGLSIKALAGKYHLAESTVKKILYHT